MTYGRSIVKWFYDKLSFECFFLCGSGNNIVVLLGFVVGVSFKNNCEKKVCIKYSQSIRNELKYDSLTD